MGIEFTFRYFFTRVTRHWHFLPMIAESDGVIEAGPNRKEGARGRIVLGLKED